MCGLHTSVTTNYFLFVFCDAANVLIQTVLIDAPEIALCGHLFCGLCGEAFPLHGCQKSQACLEKTKRGHTPLLSFHVLNDFLESEGG
ncbi:unnamed protein product [Calypogeia fissa]